MKIGDIIKFGKYDWRIIDIQDEKVLIITKNIVEMGNYHGKRFDNKVKITWADCDLRKYLNIKFFDKFNSEEKEKIISVNNQNPDNPWYLTKGGEETQDKIFLLSLYEVCHYFGDSTEKLQNTTGKRLQISNKKNHISDVNDNNRMAKNDNGEYECWLLRSPGCFAFQVAGVYVDGEVAVEGMPVCHPDKEKMGIRPALWMKLK